MKTFWKVLGFAALAAGLTPYKVNKDEETGENSYQALLWRGSSKRDEDGGNLDIRINLGEGTLSSKIMDAVEKKKEAHLFSDELSVEYHVTDEEEAAAEDAADAAEDTADAAEDTADAAEDATAADGDTATTVEDAAVADEDVAE